MELVFRKKDEVLTTSQLVARAFSKRHSDVLRAIDNLECSQEFSERNFALAKTKDKQGKERRSFNITKDGFTFLAMGSVSISLPT